MANWRMMIVIMVLLALAGVNAEAAGGFYLEGGDGFGEIDHNDTLFDSNADAKNASVGFIVSPNAFSTSNRPSYTLRVGYDRLLLEDQNDITIKSHGFRIDNGFGWPLYKGEGARVTLGPNFRVGYYWGKSDEATVKTWASSFGLGPELNANVKLNDDLGLGVSVGYAFNFFLGRIDDGVIDDTYSGHRYNGYAVVSLLFQ